MCSLHDMLNISRFRKRMRALPILCIISNHISFLVVAIQLHLRIKITYKYKVLMSEISSFFCSHSFNYLYIVGRKQTIRAIRCSSLPPSWIYLTYFCDYIIWIKRDFCIVSYIINKQLGLMRPPLS